MTRPPSLPILEVVKAAARKLTTARKSTKRSAIRLGWQHTALSGKSGGE
jgi:hypothetical protein